MISYRQLILFIINLAPSAYVSGDCPPGGSNDLCGIRSISEYGGNCSCKAGLCCSRFGNCGPTSGSKDSEAYYCGTGCQPDFGLCKTPPTCPAAGSNDYCGVDGTGLPTGGFATPCLCSTGKCCSQSGYCQPAGQCLPPCQSGCPSAGTNLTGSPPLPTRSLPAPWLYVEGNTIKLGGRPWFARGINLPDLRSCGACSKANAPTATYKQLTDEAVRRATAAVTDWKAQVIRVGVYTDTSAGDVSPVADADYLNSLTTLVNHITNTLGVYTVLAVWVDPANNASSSVLSEQLNIPNDGMVALWQKLAVPFAANPRVLFAITNEPHCADGGSCAKDHDSNVRDGMSRVVAAIRAVEKANGSPYPHIVVAQGCRNYSLDLSCYIGNRLSDPQVAYEAHVYAAANSAVLSAASSIPVIIGEVGPKNSPTCGLDMSFAALESFLKAAEQRQIPYMGWTFHQACEPNLLKATPGSSNCGLGLAMFPVDDSYSSSGSTKKSCGSNVAWGCWLYKWLTTNGNKVGNSPGPIVCSTQLQLAG